MPTLIQEGAKAGKASITTAVHEFDTGLERLGQYVQRLQAINDRIVGGGPREVVKANTVIATPEQSLLGAINGRRSYFMEALSDLESAINHLEQNI